LKEGGKLHLNLCIKEDSSNLNSGLLFLDCIVNLYISSPLLFFPFESFLAIEQFEFINTTKTN